MFSVILACLGLFYIIAQSLLAMSFKGYWRAAALLPLPILLILLISTERFSSALPLEIKTFLLVGLPAAVVYLSILSAIHFAARMIEVERAHDPVSNRFGR